MSTIAIDFGTTRTKVAYLDPLRNQPELMHLSDVPYLPSVFYVSVDGDVHFGDDAECRIRDDPKGAILTLKRSLRDSELRVNRKKVTPEDLLKLMFNQLRCRAGAEIQVLSGVAPDSVILTIPSRFGPTDMKVMQSAAGAAGFRDINFIREPVSAARAWLNGASSEDDAIVVLDCGGGTVDWACVVKRSGRFSEFDGCPPGGDERIGGHDIDEELSNKFNAKLEEMGIDAGICPIVLREVRAMKEHYCRYGKIRPVKIEGTELLLDVATVDGVVNRRFVRQIVDGFKVYLQSIHEKLGKARPKVLLVGGSSLTKGLKEALTAECDCDLHTWDRSQFAPVLGAIIPDGVKEPAEARPIEARQVERSVDHTPASSQVVDKEGAFDSSESGLRARVLQAYAKWRELFDNCCERGFSEILKSEFGLSEKDVEEAVLVGIPEAVALYVAFDDSDDDESLDSLLYELENDPRERELFQKAWALEIQSGVPGIERLMIDLMFGARGLVEAKQLSNTELAEILDAIPLPFGPHLLDGRQAVGFVRHAIKRTSERTEEDDRNGSARTALTRLFREIDTVALRVQGEGTNKTDGRGRIVGELESLVKRGIELALVPLFTLHYIVGNLSAAKSLISRISASKKIKDCPDVFSKRVALCNNLIATIVFGQMSSPKDIEQALELFEAASEKDTDLVLDHVNLKLFVEVWGGVEKAYEFYSSMPKGQVANFRTEMLGTDWYLHDIGEDSPSYDEIISASFRGWFVDALHRAHDEGNLEASAELIAFHLGSRHQSHQAIAETLVKDLIEHGRFKDQDVRDDFLIDLGKWFEFFLRDSSIYWGPLIPENKYNNMCSGMLKKFSTLPKHKIALYHDSTLLGGGGDGFAITTKGLVTKELWDDPDWHTGPNSKSKLKEACVEGGKLVIVRRYSPNLKDGENIHKIAAFLRCYGLLYE